jgi:DNA-directed RNA polymerase subunit beta'
LAYHASRRRQGGLTATELETLSGSTPAVSFAEAPVGSENGVE